MGLGRNWWIRWDGRPGVNWTSQDVWVGARLRVHGWEAADKAESSDGLDDAPWRPGESSQAFCDVWEGRTGRADT